MDPENTTTPTTTPAAEPTQPAAPAAPAPAPAAPAAPAAKPEFSPEQQAYISELIRSRLDQEKQRAADKTKTAEERIAELEEKAANAEKTAVAQVIARAAANTHNPELVSKLVDVTGLTSADVAAIEAKVTEFLTANAYLVKADAAPAPNLTPAPGVTNSGDKRFMTEAEMDAITPEELASDPEKMKLYDESLKALGAQG